MAIGRIALLAFLIVGFASFVGYLVYRYKSEGRRQDQEKAKARYERDRAMWENTDLEDDPIDRELADGNTSRDTDRERYRNQR